MAEPSSVPAARRAAQTVRGVMGSCVNERVGLLVSELVGNAVVHGSRRSTDPLRMRVWTSPTGVRVAVSDRGGGFEPPPRDEPRPDDPGSLGLYLVDRLADRWGVDGGPGTEVWFEVDTTSATPA